MNDDSDDVQGWRYGDSVDSVVQAYREFLLVKYPGHLKPFDDRYAADREAAQAEAVMFSMLRALKLKPKVAEIIGQGGVDFTAHHNDSEIAVEVTVMESDTLMRKSGIPDVLTDGAFAFELVTDSLMGKATAKAAQMARHPGQRLLIIASLHSGAGLVLNTLAAQRLLTSDTVISVPVGDTLGTAREVAQLRNSVFFRFDRKRKAIVPCRRSISAIVLATISDEGTNLTGLLHPDPSVPFDISSLPRVPFIRLSKWPLEGGRIPTEWVIAHPRVMTHYHNKVNLTDAELRGL